MKYGLIVFLFIISGIVSASEPDEVDESDDIQRMMAIVNVCYNDSMLAKHIALARDAGETVDHLQNILIKKTQSSKTLTVSDLTFGLLMVEMVYDREKTTPDQFQKSVYINCLKIYDMKPVE